MNAMLHLRDAASGPIQALWDSLHSNGYLNNANTTLALPAANQLGSASITTLLNDATLFPNASLSMTLTSAQPPGTAIVLSGVLNGTFLGFANPTATATFSIDNAQNAQLAVSVQLPDGNVLFTAFPMLAATAPGTQQFKNSLLTASSSASGNVLSFAATPVPDSAYAGMWSKGPGTMTGAITGWATRTTQVPTFALATTATAASLQAGLLPIAAQLKLTSGGSDAGSGAVLGTVASKGMGVDTIPVSFPIPVPLATSPILDSGAMSLAINNLTQLAPLFLGQQLANLVPARFPIGNVFGLTDLQVGLDNTGAHAGFIQITLSTSPQLSIALLPANLVNLTNITLKFFVDSTPNYRVSFSGGFYLNNNPDLAFTAGFSIPNPLVFASNTKDIDVSTLLQVIPGLPTLPKSGLNITTLSMTFSPVDLTYTFNGAITATQGTWSIDLGHGLTLIELDSITLAVARTTSGTSVNIGASVVFLNIPLDITAVSQPGSPGWVFTGTIAPVSPLKLVDIAKQLLPFIPSAAVPNIELDYLQCELNSSTNTYRVIASADWKMDILPVTITANFLLQSSRAKSTDPATYSGSVTGEIDINNLVLQVSYVFDPTTTDITFAYRSLTVSYHKDANNPQAAYVAISLDNSNVGDLFSFLLSFAQPGKNLSLTAPWNALEKIELPNLTVKVTLATKAIEVDIDLKIDLGFIDIKRFTLLYTRQYGKAKFNLQLSGTFLGQTYGSDSTSQFVGSNPPLSWDPINEAPPVVPGTGTQVFDLEYLGIGQHLSLRAAPPATMDAVIAALEKALVPSGNPNQSPATQLPGLAYNAASNWLIGTRFTAMSTVELSIVFNDPNLYGMLIQLSGSRAGPLAGLRFEILYRKISDTIGVYHIELTLPDVMRHIELGEVSITLPIITIDIYTNGNFRVDAGFPPSLTDFSRSFSVQVFPFIGYGGFYFAVLNGQTSTSVPVIYNGNFSPVLEFGFALQVGVGKTISVGILSGGISITVGGMVQGVLAWFNPDKNDLAPARFFHLTGTVAVVGKVFATVDFGIIQASVSLVVYASVTLDVESYRAILISVSAGVEVEVSIKILFIRIHFSFGTTITESFVIGSDSRTPWLTTAPPGSSSHQSLLLPGRRSYRAKRNVARQRLFGLMRRRPARTLQVRGQLLRHARLNATAPIPIQVTAIPLISKALTSDFSFPGGPTPPAGTSSPVLALLLGVNTSTDPAAAANVLLGFLLEWVVDAIGHEHDTVSAAVIDEILEALKQPDVPDTIFSYTALKTLFTSNQLTFTLVARDPNAGSETDMAIMAMIPEMQLSVPGYSIQFWNDRVPVGNYQQKINDYFAQLAAQFAANNDGSPKSSDDVANESLAIYVFRYYFAMLARSAAQAAKQLLASTSTVLTATSAAATSIDSLVNQYNNNYTARLGDTLASIAPLFNLSAAALLASNPQYTTQDPAVGQPVFIPLSSVVYVSIANDTLDGLAACFGVTAAALTAANPTVNFNPLASGTSISIPATRVLHTVQAGEAGPHIASEFGIELAALMAANPTVNFNALTPGTVLLIPLGLSPFALTGANQDTPNLLAQNVSLSLGDIAFTAAATDSFAYLSTKFGVDLPKLLTANFESLTILNPGQTINFGTLASTTQTGATFNGLLAFWYDRVAQFDPTILSTANPTLTLSAGQTLAIPQATQRNTTYQTQQGDTFTKLLGAFSGLTLAQLLANNSAIGLDANQPLSLPSVQYLTSNSYLLAYTATTGDTLTSIAANFFNPDPHAQAAAVQSLQQWNGQISATQPLTAGTTVTVPYASSIGNICRLFKLTTTQLAANAAFGNVSLLATRASVTAPDVMHTTTSTDTLSGIAQTFDLSLEQLTAKISLVTGLFQASTPIKVTAIPGMRFDILNPALAGSGGFTTAFNMASRFMMNGLRLPAPQFQGLTAPSATLSYPMYALIGQEFPVAAPLATNYTFTLTRNGTPAWFSISGGTLSMQLAAAEIQRVSDFQALQFQTGVGANDAQPLATYSYIPDQQPVGSITWWHTPDLPTGLTPANQKVSQPAIWKFPSALLDLLAASQLGADQANGLPYIAKVGTTQSDGSVSSSALVATRFATTIDITVQKPSDATAGTYLVVGADQAGMQRLLSVWAYLTTQQTTATLYVSYSQQSSNNNSNQGTVVSDAVDRAKSFLLKTNLSTESHGAPQFTLQGEAITMLNTGLLENPSATLESADALNFLQLLWECSVVKSGGYYLRYATTDGNVGLPNTLFASGHEAVLQFIVVLDQQTNSNPVALAFNNAMLVGDNVDAGAHSLFFEALTHTITTTDTLTAIAQQYQSYLTLDAAALAVINQTVVGTLVPGAGILGQTATADDSFGSIALRAGVTVAAFGTAIGGTPGLLKPDALLQLAGNSVQQLNPGDTLASIAREYDFLDPASLATLNAATVNLLLAGATMNVPGQSTYTVIAGDTFGSVAKKLGVDLATLGDVNAITAILNTSGSIVVGANSLRLTANLPAGRAGFNVTRTNPMATVPADETPQQALNTLFNLLGFAIGGNGYFTSSNAGLPAGPTTQNSGDDTGPWKYQQILSAFPFATSNESMSCALLPTPANNPYAGIVVGAQAALNLTFQDVLGNQTDGSSLPPLINSMGYTDEIIGLATWPAVTSAYRFAQDTVVPSQGTLIVGIAVAPDQFVPDTSAVQMPTGTPDASILDAAGQRALNALARYAAVSYQLQQHDVTCYLGTSLGAIADAETLGAEARVTLLGLANSAYVFLSNAQNLTLQIVQLGPQGTYQTLAQLSNTSGAQPIGFPVSVDDLGQLNANAGADLLFGVNTPLTVPFNTLAAFQESAQAIATRTAISVTTLADQNPTVALAPAMLINTAVRPFSVPSGAPLSLSALALQMGIQVDDGPGNVPGLATSNATQPLTANLTLVLGDKSFPTTGTQSLNDAATFFSEGGATVTVVDVAMANQYLNGIFPVGTPLKIACALTTAGDTLTSVASLYGPPSGQSGTPVEQMLQGNQTVPGIWPVGTALFIEKRPYNVQQGDTLTSVAAANNTGVGSILSDNMTIAFVSGAQLLIPYIADATSINGAMYQAAANQKLTDIAALFANWPVTELAALNAGMPGLFSSTPIVIGQRSVTPTLSSTFTTLAAGFGLSVPSFATQIASLPNIVREDAAFATPPIASAAADTLAQCAQRFGILPGTLAAANATLPGLLKAGQALNFGGVAYPTYANDSFGLLVARINADRVANKLAPLSVANVFSDATLSQNTLLLARALLAPPLTVNVSASVTPANAQPILNLSVSLTTSRDPSRVAPEFSNAPLVVSAPATIVAQPFSDSSSATQQSLTQFATDFEKAFPGLKLATGPNQIQGSSLIAKPSLRGASGSTNATTGGTRSLWVVNFTANGQGFTYQAVPASTRFFAVPPLTTQSFTSSGVAVPTYDSSKGLQWPATNKFAFQSADPDQWNQTFLQAVDLVLSPSYAVPGCTDSAVAANIQTIIAAKADIASGLASTVQSILATGDTTGLDDAKDALEQQLLITLSSAYAVQSLVQTDFGVQGSGAGNDPDTAPQLSGKLVARNVNTPPAASSDPAHPLAALATLTGVSDVFLARTIAQVPNIVQPDVTVTTTAVQGKTYSTSGADTLASIANFFAITIDVLAATMTIGAGQTLFRPDSVINATPTVAPATLLTVSDVAQWMQLEVPSLIEANLQRTGFFASGSTITLAAKQYTPASGDTLAVIAAYFGGQALFAQQLVAVDANSLPGSYLLNPSAPPNGLQLLPQFSFSAASVPLATTGSRITSLFSTKDPAAQTLVTLALDYQVNQMEFDIHSVQGIQGYQSSSWLTFIIPVTDSPTTQGQLGQMQVPIPLRGYPLPATISDQSAQSSDNSVDANKTFAQWDYGFTTSRQFAAQDQMTLEVMFNQSMPGPSQARRAMGQRDLSNVIDLLAGFSVVWSDIAHDLAQLPDTTNGKAAPAAAFAVAALADLSSKIQDAWNNPPQLLASGELPGKTYTYVLSTLAQQNDGNANQATYSTLVLDRVGQSVDFSTDPDDFLFTADASYAAQLNGGSMPVTLATLFATYGFTLSGSEIIKQKTPGTANTDWLIVDYQGREVVDGSAPFGAPQTYRVMLVNVISGEGVPAGSQILQVWRQILWPALRLSQDAASGSWLNGTQAGTSTRLAFDISSTNTPVDKALSLDFDFYRLNVLLLQDAWGGTYISRNADLLPGVSTNLAFVYKTPLVMFPTQLTPLLSRTVQTSMAGNSLTVALSAFFQNLVAAQTAVLPQTTRNMRIAVAYWQSLDGVTSPTLTPLNFRNPLLLTTFYPFNVTTDWSSTAGGFCDQLAKAVTNNAAAMGVNPVATARWVVDVVVYGYGDDQTPQAVLSVENQLFNGT